MPDYVLTPPEKKHALIKLNEYPRTNPNKSFDPSVEQTTPQTLFTPLLRVCNVELTKRIITSTVTEVETSGKAEAVPWLRKFAFDMGNRVAKDENIRMRELDKIRKPIDYNQFYLESFVSVDEGLEGCTSYDFVPGDEKYMIFDFDERNFAVKEMKDFVLEYPSRVVIDRNGEEAEYGCNANDMSNYVLVEVKDDRAYYYLLKNSLKLKRLKTHHNSSEQS
ncbi:hypothetical protein VCUG_02247 [Vavraia culicis subsp. floridensis]|uniref:Uncharacterized protein n=1 Tax=Vavraia culicis (isolate floridensis) TaxID=948595 RepID=L2GT51_VAVCU|nr:uncharacterized protein VCUG_02242 [Vavraia culicis subsp. floridensis]XP_008075257.1 uncharacterized protein VCUG_02247 [Vavraia culicis subsp. floridensis]ELA46275.1 hypothetical protein VCUG_02242 [Vavraia culicis subsp. floridensis]ELA46280.1 hypothetical protein VCUG_02247 [Vavraia culicis subsp. floridensis]